VLLGVGFTLMNEWANTDKRVDIQPLE
jgi:hypothetical protein